MFILYHKDILTEKEGIGERVGCKIKNLLFNPKKLLTKKQKCAIMDII